MMAIDNELASDNAKKLFNTITCNDFEVKKLYENEQLYYDFISVLGRYTVKDTLFKTNTPDKMKDIESWYNPTDEALALLLLENGIHRWIKKLDLKKQRNNQIWLVKLTKADNKSLPPYRYTQCSVGEGENEKHRNEGWGLYGITRYTELVKECKHFRTTAKFTSFSEKLLSSLKGPTLTLSQKRLKRKRDAESQIGCAEKLQQLFQMPELKVDFDINTSMPMISYEANNTLEGSEEDGHI